MVSCIRKSSNVLQRSANFRSFQPRQFVYVRPRFHVRLIGTVLREFFFYFFFQYRNTFNLGRYSTCGTFYRGIYFSIIYRHLRDFQVIFLMQFTKCSSHNTWRKAGSHSQREVDRRTAGRNRSKSVTFKVPDRPNVFTVML